MNGILLQAGGLRCDLVRDAARSALDTAPRFSWVVNGLAKQCAWQIRVHQGGTVVWDSKRQESDASTSVAYGGPALLPDALYAWDVRVWGEGAEPTPWSERQAFRTGPRGPYRAAAEPLSQIERVPVRRERLADDAWHFDFGAAAFGSPVIEVPQHMAGKTITLRLGEKCSNGRIDRAPGGHIRYQSLEIRLPDHAGDCAPVLPADARNTGPAAVRLPEEIGVVFPYQYAEIEGWEGVPSARALRQRAVWVGGDGEIAHFSCDNEVLERVWSICAHTIRATTVCGIYIDGDRERIPYEADAYINQLSHYALERAYATGRATIQHFFKQPTWPTEWQFHMPIMAWADYLQTGDERGLAAWYDELALRTLCELDRGDGLLDTRKERITPALLQRLKLPKMDDIVDWPPGSFTQGGTGERDNHEMRPVNTVVNALHALACRHMSWIAQAIGRPADADAWTARAQKTAAAINSLLYDQQAGAYFDGEGSTHHSQHSSLFTLAAGIVPDEHKARVLDFTIGRGMACSVYAAQWLLDALYLNGRPEAALALMTATHDRSWYHMILSGSSMTWEAWDHRYKNNLDWNHAWATAPLNVVARFILGVQIVTPGAAKIRIRPQPGSLKRIEGTVPTVRGFVAVELNVEPGVSARLRVEIPGNMRAELCVPSPGLAAPKVMLDGRVIHALAEDGYCAIPDVGAGAHEVLIA
jgi:alpha-L-rhamnosidase